MNEFVERASAGLAERGHRVRGGGAADSRAAVRESRRAIRAARERPEALFDGSWKGQRAGGDGGPPVLAVGSGLAMPRGPRPRAAPVPIDVSRPLDELLGGVELDVVHVHDPFAPERRVGRAAPFALAQRRRASTSRRERVLSTQVARPLVEIFFGRLDARTREHPDTAELMERFFPGTYELVAPGAEPAPSAVAAPAGETDRARPGEDRLLPRGGAGRAAALPACAAPAAARPRVGGGDLAPRRRRAVRIARRLRERFSSSGPATARPRS